MTDIHDLEIGTSGPFLPPYESALRNAKTIDSLGYDSMAFPDHFAGFIPESIWTGDVTPLSFLQKSPHTFYELFTIMAACSTATENVKLLSSVTEPIRRHPMLLAQAFLTLDHISNGRAILGIGAGEIENIEPYGLRYSGQVGKLREALKIIRRVWETPDPFDFDGKFWKMKDAVMSLRPLDPNRPPPIWIAGHGPKMLKITAEFGDGWIPAVLPPQEYGKRLNEINSHRKKLDKNGPFTAALWNYCILDEDSSTIEELKQNPIAKAFALTMSLEGWKRLGYDPPFGDDFNALTDYIPMRYNREETMQAIEQVPKEVLDWFYIAGNAETIIKKLEEYTRAGMNHIILWNITGMFDLERVRSSYKVLKEILAYVKG